MPNKRFWNKQTPEVGKYILLVRDGDKSRKQESLLTHLAPQTHTVYNSTRDQEMRHQSKAELISKYLVGFWQWDKTASAFWLKLILLIKPMIDFLKLVLTLFIFWIFPLNLMILPYKNKSVYFFESLSGNISKQHKIARLGRWEPSFV